jgi:tetratricopeptide (TPR) repeat protein
MRKYARKVLFIVIVLIYVSMAFGEDNANIQATIDQAKKYINENKPDEAIKVLDKIIDRRCSNAEACFLKGKSLCMLERDSDALKFYEGALSTNRNYADAQKGKCEALCNLSRDAEFRQCTDELAKIGSFKTAADNIINIKCPFRTSGNISQESYIYKQALDLYNRSIAENKNNTGAWNNEGVALGELGRYNESISCFERAIAINSTFAEGWSNKGVSLDKMGRHQGALQSYNESLKINPRLAEAWYNKGISLKDVAFKEAHECYLNATRYNPNLAGETFAWIYKKV